MTDWKPISTAPKDGIEIQLLLMDDIGWCSWEKNGWYKKSSNRKGTTNYYGLGEPSHWKVK